VGVAARAPRQPLDGEALREGLGVGVGVEPVAELVDVAPQGAKWVRHASSLGATVEVVDTSGVASSAVRSEATARASRSALLPRQPESHDDYGPAATVEFGALLRELREARGWSLAELARHITFHRGYIGKVEHGQQWPQRGFAELSDTALNAGGDLTAAWDEQDRQRKDAARVGRILTTSVEDSLRLIAAVEERGDLGDLDHGVRDLAVAYLGTPPGPMLLEGVELRAEALRRLKEHQYQPTEQADLYVMLGRVQGVLAYAALDLGDAAGALAHAAAAWVCAERAGDNELRAWVRGTQSLIARFQSDYTSAAAYVRDGLRYAAPGTARVRLLCGLAQCRANLGDSAGANRALNVALRERERIITPDSLGGLFEFSLAKQHYYAGSSLIWLGGGTDAQRAVREASEAIALWEQEPPETRSLDDEALAHVYEATAHLQLGDVDAAGAALRPVLDLPTDRQISWITKRVGRVGDLLREPQFENSVAAGELYDEIRALAS